MPWENHDHQNQRVQVAMVQRLLLNYLAHLGKRNEVWFAFPHFASVGETTLAHRNIYEGPCSTCRRTFFLWMAKSDFCFCFQYLKSRVTHKLAANDLLKLKRSISGSQVGVLVLPCTSTITSPNLTTLTSMSHIVNSDTQPGEKPK